MSALRDLVEIIKDSTIVYRKGEAVEVKGNVTHVYGYPETPDRGVLVDLHFVNVGFTEAAADRDAFVAAMEAAFGPGEFCDITRERMRQGPSYIELGGWLGSQELALRLLALGQHHKVWQAITPAVLGVEGELADRMAGSGYVMAGGYTP